MSKKSTFIASLAHDLKNSVGNSMMYSELLSTELKELAETDGPVNSEIEGLVLMSENIRMSSSKLINQINSWVYVQHLISGNYQEELSTFNFIELINSVADSNFLSLSQKSIVLEKDWDDQDIQICADYEILKLALDNLLIQSIIFSNSGDTIIVSVRSDESFITISVSDSYGNSREPVIDRFLGKAEISGDEIPDEGILKATGYGMIFCGLALKRIGAHPKVEKNERGGNTFSFQLRK